MGVYKLDHFDTSIEIRKARWHPGSTNDSHLLVLTSENTFCLYECEVGKSPKLVKSWKIGRTPLSSPSKIPDFTCLGEAAVDFDFVTPSLREPEMFSGKDIKNVAVDWSQIDWRILVLRGNGEVVIVYGNVLLDQYQSPVVTRTLSMHPPADDNYGIDSCSIMCIQTTPPIVVIATCTGKIYHAILLKNETSDENDVEKRNSSQSNSMYSVLSECPISDETLYVYECIEVGDFYGDTDKKLNFPINLHCDKINKYRYFCTHNHGLQMVTVPMVSELEDYLNISDDIADVCLPSPSNQSSSQHWICGRTKQRGTNDATPILGIGIFQEPYVLVALLHTGDVVSRSLIDLRYFPKIEPLEPVTNKEKKPTKEPFDVYIKKLLKCKTPEPNVDTRLRSMEVCLQESDDYLRKEFARHDHIHEEISKKVRALKIMKSHLLKQLDSLMETRKELQQTAERLAERYEDIKYAQEKLAQRSKEVLRLVNCKEPTITPIERAEAVKLRDMEIDVKKMGVRLKELRMKSDQLTQQIENNDMNERKKEIVFKGGQEGIIKNTLNNMGKDIKELIDELKELDEEVCNYTK
ncbi:nuclear pore complex protein Nup88-like [Augochlora pura]